MRNLGEAERELSLWVWQCLLVFTCLPSVWLWVVVKCKSLFVLVGVCVILNWAEWECVGWFYCGEVRELELSGGLSYNDALLMQICLVTGSMREPAEGGLGVKPQLTLLMFIISLVRLCVWGGWECGDLGVPYLGKTSALLISINLWALQMYPHLSGLALSLQ